jgi:hypothetical protein
MNQYSRNIKRHQLLYAVYAERTLARRLIKQAMTSYPLYAIHKTTIYGEYLRTEARGNGAEYTRVSSPDPGPVDLAVITQCGSAQLSGKTNLNG